MSEIDKTIPDDVREFAFRALQAAMLLVRDIGVDAGIDAIALAILEDRDRVAAASDELAYVEFARRYVGAFRSGGDYAVSCILSGRLRDLDKRARKANARADELQRQLAAKP